MRECGQRAGRLRGHEHRRTQHSDGLRGLHRCYELLQGMARAVSRSATSRRRVFHVIGIVNSAEPDKGRAELARMVESLPGAGPPPTWCQMIGKRAGRGRWSCARGHRKSGASSCGSGGMPAEGTRRTRDAIPKRAEDDTRSPCRPPEPALISQESAEAAGALSPRLSMSTLCARSVSLHHDGVLHQTSLRSRWTMMTRANSLP